MSLAGRNWLLRQLTPRVENHCFGCGASNARGMQLTFEQDDERRRIVGRFTLGKEYEGGSGFLHGGIIATLIDEAMGKANRFRDVLAVTAELNVEYHRPVPVGAPFVVEAEDSRCPALSSSQARKDARQATRNTEHRTRNTEHRTKEQQWTS